MLEKLSESLTKTVKKIALSGLVDERLVKEVVKDLQRALLGADVKVQLVMSLSRRVEERALKEEPKAGLSKREHVVAIIYEELVRLMGEGAGKSFPLGRKVMLVGLQGSGKTTVVVKLARFYKKRGRKPFLIAADTYRPAALEQLTQLAEAQGIEVYGDRNAQDPLTVVERGMEEGRRSDLLLLDTAGRHRSEADLFEEMKALSEVFQPDEKLLVIDASLGQQAGNQARAFDEAIGLTGVIVTKLDSSAKGGGALSAVAETSAPIRFIGVGERVEDLELFQPDRFVSRLLGMGDLKSLMEKAKETIDEEQVKDFLKGEFTLEDLRAQIQSLQGLGPLNRILKMIPGMGMALPEEASQMTEVKMGRFLTILDSMTREERQRPKVIDGSRIRRIARGSGTATEEVKELMAYHRTMKKALKGFKKGAFNRGAMAKMMRRMRPP
jgi:signal recognition particle subunit SRP54